jgi:hypothetical protein
MDISNVINCTLTVPKYLFNASLEYKSKTKDHERIFNAD